MAQPEIVVGDITTLEVDAIVNAGADSNHLLLLQRGRRGRLSAGARG